MGKDPVIFSAAIFKNQIPSCCFTIDVVEATRKQFKDDVIDCIQPINGLYRFDFLKKESKLQFLAKGLKIVGKTIPAMDWAEGLDSPKVRVVIGGLPRETPDSLILDALTALGVEIKSNLEHDYYRDKVNGGFLKIKSGRRAIMINKPSSPLPQIIKIGDREASIRHWGQKEKSSTPNDNTFGNSKKATLVSKKDDNQMTTHSQSDKIDSKEASSIGTNTPLSQSLFSQDPLVIPPTVPLADIFNFKSPSVKPNEVIKPKKQPRGRSKSRDSKDAKRKLSNDERLESPHKQVKHLIPSIPPESYADHSDNSDQEGDGSAV